MRLLIIFITLLTNTFEQDIPNIKNIVINKELKTYNNLTFLDSKENIIELNNYKGKLIILNFWATWCAPCKEEMPSLDSLKSNVLLDNLEIFPINIGRENLIKSENFFDELKIKNLEIYFDNPVTLAKRFGLRGVPTTILFNKNGEEFARIIGSIDFSDKTFINWLSNYN
jgi:thiol-disulfide isomerase/thioredoxin